jgi:hypothetical protein
MRSFGSLVEKAVRMREPSIPASRRDRANPPPLNHLDEGLSELFNQACVCGDLDAATDLAALLEQWHARRDYSDEQARRLDRIALKRMHGEVERRQIMRGGYYPNSGLRAAAFRAP